LLSGDVDDTHQVKSTLQVTGIGAQSGASVNESADGQVITNASGSLSKMIDPSTPTSSLVAQGNTITVGSYKFEAVNDAYSISQLTFNLAGGYPAIQTLKLMDGSSQVGTSLNSANEVTFNLATPIHVLANSSKTIDLEATLGTIGTYAGATGSDIKATLTGLIERDSQGTAEVIKGLSIPSNSQYAYRSVPTISTLPLPSGILTVGTKTLQKFSIAASSANPVSWSKIAFTVDKTTSAQLDGCSTAGCTNVKLYDGSTEIPGVMVASANFGSTDKTGTITFVPNTEQQIAASQTKTYELKGLVSGKVTSGEYIMTRIANPSSYAASAKAFANVGALIYADVSTAGTVSAGDVRKTAVDSYAATNDSTTAGTITLTEFANDVPTTIFTSNGSTMSSDVAEWTVTSVAGDETDVTAIVLTHDDGAVVTMTGGAYKNGETLTVTRTAGGYAANTMVATGNSDLGLALTPGVAPTASIVWSDVSAQSHSISTGDWTNDALVNNLPFDTQTLSGSGSN
ncbi:MAG: hypothetical protein GX947_03630, partial [Tissierellia bacterium]|nr:hypothetical protein [Tissierellia bacterium]